MACEISHGHYSFVFLLLSRNKEKPVCVVPEFSKWRTEAIRVHFYFPIIPSRRCIFMRNHITIKCNMVARWLEYFLLPKFFDNIIQCIFYQNLAFFMPNVWLNILGNIDQKLVPLSFFESLIFLLRKNTKIKITAPSGTLRYDVFVPDIFLGLRLYFLHHEDTIIKL